MKLIIKATDDMGFTQTTLDVDIHSTIDHVIAALTMKYNTIDATKLILFHRGRALPEDEEVINLGLLDEAEIEVRYKRSCCCQLL